MKILFIHNGLTTFVKIDRDLLAKHHEVEELYLKQKKDIHPWQIWKKVKRNDLVFGWFSSWHTFLPIQFSALLKKPSVLVTGGYDTANLPDASYGNQRFIFSRRITNLTIKTATHLICNSNFTKAEVLNILDIPPARISVIYHGLPDTGFSATEKQNIALNVGNVSHPNLFRKGIKPFLLAANQVPHYQFVQVGKPQDNSASTMSSLLAPNTAIKGFVSQADLDQLYQDSKVYIQPSLHEGFGMSVVEAMLAGCIPIVSQHGALPEVVREYGILLKDISPASIKEGIKTAEKNYPFEPKQIRNFALQAYSLPKRERALVAVLDEVVQSW